MTASPAQRIVMLYDRLALDIRLARSCDSAADRTVHLGHATNIVAELYGSLDQSAGGAAENLARLYTFLIGELMLARSSGAVDRLEATEAIVAQLHDAWVAAADQLAGAGTPAAAGVLSRTG